MNKMINRKKISRIADKIFIFPFFMIAVILILITCFIYVVFTYLSKNRKGRSFRKILTDVLDSDNWKKAWDRRIFWRRRKMTNLKKAIKRTFFSTRKEKIAIRDREQLFK